MIIYYSLYLYARVAQDGNRSHIVASSHLRSTTIPSFLWPFYFVYDSHHSGKSTGIGFRAPLNENLAIDQK